MNEALLLLSEYCSIPIVILILSKYTADEDAESEGRGEYSGFRFTMELMLIVITSTILFALRVWSSAEMPGRMQFCGLNDKEIGKFAFALVILAVIMLLCFIYIISVRRILLKAQIKKRKRDEASVDETFFYIEYYMQPFMMVMLFEGFLFMAIIRSLFAEQVVIDILLLPLLLLYILVTYILLLHFKFFNWMMMAAGTDSSSGSPCVIKRYKIVFYFAKLEGQRDQAARGLKEIYKDNGDFEEAKRWENKGKLKWYSRIPFL